MEPTNALDNENTARLGWLTARAASVGLVFFRLAAEASMAREYRVWLESALFGGSEVVRQWGVERLPDPKTCGF